MEGRSSINEMACDGGSNMLLRLKEKSPADSLSTSSCKCSHKGVNGPAEGQSWLRTAL
jgi:hypothetical protein